MSEYLNTGEWESSELSESLEQFTSAIAESVKRNTRKYGTEIRMFTSEEKDELYNRLTSYTEFELLADERLYSVPVQVLGRGLFLAFDHNGALEGVQKFDETDLITGEIEDAVAQPVPILDDEQLASAGEIPQTVNETASAVVVLKNARFATSNDGDYDMSQYRIGIPLVYPLHVGVRKTD